MFGHLAAFTTNWIDEWGIVGIFLAMLLESACIPLPSEVTMPLGGYLAHQGYFPLWLAILAGALGNLAGSLIAWGIAYYARDAAYGLIRNERSQHHLAVAQRWFERFGLSAVFFSRLLPILRTYISLPAGFFKAPFLAFSLLTLAGSFIWAAVLAYLGYWLGGNWDRVEFWLKPLSFAVAIAIIVAGWIWIRSLRRDRTGPADE
ncbi:MAG TPA: DedA family protein [Limnochordia bacterium]|nr:DedA family protein [Limnochordia bacterium]